jgi:hypothetical protein
MVGRVLEGLPLCGHPRKIMDFESDARSGDDTCVRRDVVPERWAD